MNRKAKRQNQKNIQRPKASIKFIISFFTVVVFIIIIFLFYPSQFSQNQKISLYGKSSSGDTVILVIDQNNYSLTQLIIPANTQVQTAYQLGSWKMESVWALSDQEKIGDSLVKNTLIKSFSFPVQYGISGNLDSFSQKKFTSLLNFMLHPSKLNFIDRLLIIRKLYSSSVTTINLAETQTLNNKILLSGEEGYVLTNNIPLSIIRTFSQPLFFEHNLNIKLINNTGSAYPNNLLNNFIESLGSKIISIDNADSEDYDCFISAKNKDIQNYLSSVLECKNDNDLRNDTIDVQISVGKKFLERF